MNTLISIEIIALGTEMQAKVEAEEARALAHWAGCYTFSWGAHKLAISELLISWNLG